MVTRVPIGQVLKDRGLVDDAQLFIALTLHCAWAVPVGEVLVRWGWFARTNSCPPASQEIPAPAARATALAPS